MSEINENDQVTIAIVSSLRHAVKSSNFAFNFMDLPSGQGSESRRVSGDLRGCST